MTERFLHVTTKVRPIDAKIKPGTEFMWMAMRRDDKVIASPNRRWAGPEPFNAYSFSLTHNCTNYRFIVPKVCCNVALLSKREIRDRPKLDVDIIGGGVKACTDDEALLAISMPDGETKPLGKDPDNCALVSELETAKYTLVASAECGQQYEEIFYSAPVETQAIETPSEKTTFFVETLIGTERLPRPGNESGNSINDTANVLTGRVGLKHRLVPTLSFIPSLGLQYRDNLNDAVNYNELGASLDLAVETPLSKGIYLGAGLGMINIGGSDDEFNLFIRLSGALSQSVDWIVESRGFDSDGEATSSIRDNHALNAGLRFAF